MLLNNFFWNFGITDIEFVGKVLLFVYFLIGYRNVLLLVQEVNIGLSTFIVKDIIILMLLFSTAAASRWTF